MKTKTENYYLFIHLNLPPIASWDPRPSVLRWLKNKDRRNKAVNLAKEQSYYKGVFSSYKHESDKTKMPEKKYCKNVIV